jgi:hypothetical protein
MTIISPAWIGRPNVYQVLVGTLARRINRTNPIVMRPCGREPRSSGVASCRGPMAPGAASSPTRSPCWIDRGL